MKKFIGVIAIALALTIPNFGIAQAADVNVQGGGKVFVPKDFQEGVGIGVKANFPGVFGEEKLDLSTGIDLFPTEAELVDKDVTLAIIPLEAGYNFALSEKVTVKPIAGLDLITGSSGVDTTIGGHVGAEMEFETTIQDLSGYVGAKYLFADVDVNGVEHSLNGPVFDVGVKYRW